MYMRHQRAWYDVLQELFEKIIMKLQTWCPIYLDGRCVCVCVCVCVHGVDLCILALAYDRAAQFCIDEFRDVNKMAVQRFKKFAAPVV